MDVKIISIKNTDYITDSIEKINSNTMELKYAIDDAYNSIDIDTENGTIGKKSPITSIGCKGISVSQNGGISFSTSEGDVKGSIGINDKKQSVAKFDIVEAGSLEYGSGATVRKFTAVSLPSSKTVEFTDSESDYVVNIPSTITSDTGVIISFDKCKEGQVVNLIFGNLNGKKITSVTVSGGAELLNAKDSSDSKKILSSLYNSSNNFDNQLSFIVYEKSENSNTSKIIVER